MPDHEKPQDVPVPENPPDLQVASGETEGPACAECQSKEVRPSRGVYPQDHEKTAAGKAGFWRCGNCGSRFLGPVAPERKRRRHGKSKFRDPRDPRNRDGRPGQGWKRWIFPMLVILATIVAVIYMLDRRDSGQQQLALPDS